MVKNFLKILNSKKKEKKRILKDKGQIKRVDVFGQGSPPSASYSQSTLLINFCTLACKDGRQKQNKTKLYLSVNVV